MTTRADPMTSEEVARRHFFRHFHNVKELRRSPLARAFFRAAQSEGRQAPDYAALLEIHQAVQRILDYLERSVARGHSDATLRRQIALFKAYVLERRAPEEVTRDLALSQRQFFRDYAAICSRIAKGLTAWRAPTNAGPWYDSDELALHQIFLLRQANLTVPAMDRARQIADDEEIQPRVRAKALSALARLEIEESRYSDARTTLDRLRSFASEPQTLAELGFLADMLRWKCLRSDSDCLPGGAEVAALAPDGLAPQLYVDYLIAQSEKNRLLGDFRAARESIDQARTIVEPHLNEAIQQYVMVLRAYAEFLLASKSHVDLSEPLALLNQAIRIAHGNGLLRSALITSASLGACYLLDGNSKTGQSILEECLRSCMRFNDSNLLSSTYYTLGEFAVYSKPDLALTYFAKSGEALPSDDYRLPGFYMGMCVGNAQRGNAADAIKYAERAIQTARGMTNLRIYGAALRELAENQYHIGEKRPACETIAEAISVLEAHGSNASLVKAYGVYATITGDNRFTAKAARLH